MIRPLIVGNWKAYIASLKDAKKLFVGIDKGLPRGTRGEIVVCPPAPFIYPLAASYKGKRVSFGAQDAAIENGKHTGASTPMMLKDAGASYVIVGHSERREEGDTDEIVSKKVVAVLEAGLTPIVCVGEKERDREGHYLAGLEKSLLASLARIEPSTLKKLVIAYEPVWAVGATVSPTAREIREVIIFIRKALATRFDRTLALKVRILYGGDVNASNARDLIDGSDASGFLLGRASIDPEVFCVIVKMCSSHDSLD
jgi:triosephosphate isomerase